MGFSGRTSAAALAAVLFAVSARAGTVDESLPFVGDDASFPQGRAPRIVWPVRVELAADLGADADVAIDPETPPAGLPSPAPAFPDIGDLLAPFSGAFVDEGDVVRLAAEHPLLPRMQRLLTAVRVGYARDTRVEITLTRGADELLRFGTTTRAGAMVLDDARVEETWPAGLDAGPVLITPASIVFRTGRRVGVSVTPIGGDRLLVDLDLHASVTGGERVFDDVAVRRVAPIIDVVDVRAALPVVSGRPTVVRLGDVALTVLATRIAQKPPDGTRVVPLPLRGRGLPAALRVHPRRLQLLEDDDEAWLRSDALVVVPSAWEDAARRAGVRISAVPPALAVAEGDPAALARFDEMLAPLRAVTGYVVRDTATDCTIPCIAGTPFTAVVATMVPVAATASAEIQTQRAEVSTSIAYDVSGTFVHGAWQPTGADADADADAGAGAGPRLDVSLDVRVVHDPVPTPQSPHTDETGGAPREIALDAVRAASSTRRVTLRGRPGENDSVSLAPLDPPEPREPLGPREPHEGGR